MLKEVLFNPVNFSVIGSIVVFSVFFIYKLCRLSIAKNSSAYDKIYSLYSKNIGKEVENKTTIPASSFFYTEAVFISYNTNIKHYRALGNSLVGLGILGTFLGLSIALKNADFSFSNQATALTTIEALINGMRTAFWTSALGMATSLIYGGWYRMIIKNLENKIDLLCKELDDKYLVTPLMLTIAQNRLLSETVINIHESIKHQSEIINIIGTRISNFIEQQNNSVNELGEKISQNLEEQNSLLEEMGTNIGNNVGQQLVNKLQDSMSKLITGVTESMQENMIEASNYLRESAEMLDDSTEELNSATEKINNITKTLPEIIDCVSNVIGDVEELIPIINNLTNNMSSNNIEINETLGNIGDSAIQLNEVIISVNNCISNMKLAIENVNIQKFIDAQKEQYSKVEKLVSAQHTQIDSLTKQQFDILTNIDDLRICIEKLYDSIGAVTNIKDDVKDIFIAINEGLQEHVNLLHNQTTGLLTTYTDKFTSAAESINNTVGNLTTSVNSAANTMITSVEASAKKIKEASENVIKTKKS